MKKLLEKISKFAGEPAQKAGDQVRGTDNPPKDKDHPFKGRLVGAAESKGSTLKDLDKLAESKSLEWQLMEEFEAFAEEKENFGIGEKRKGRKSRERAKDDKVLESDDEQCMQEALQDTVSSEHKEDAAAAKAAGDKIGYYNHMYHYNRRQASIYSSEARFYGELSNKGQRYKEQASKYTRKAMECSKRVRALGGQISGADTRYDKEGSKDWADAFAANVTTAQVEENTHYFKESGLRESTDNIANIIVGEITKLISDGHTEVSPDVIIAKISAATSAPFMLKDLVAANNASPELQHYISSINPSKVKFSTDILTVKNEDPMKAKEQAQAGIEKMAARAAGRDRSLAENHNRFSEPLTGWHIINRETGSKVFNTPSFETKEAAQKYKMEKMWANHHLYAVAHTKDLQEGWESGPEERGRSMRDLADDPDWAYDQARQEKIDRAAEKEYTETKYYVYDGVQKKRVSDDFESQEEALEARRQIQLNKPHLTVLSYKTKPTLSEAPIEMDPENPMDPLVHGAGANPAKLSYRMLRAQSQLADLAARAKNATPYQWQQIARNFDELTMNINQIKHALDELAKTRAKGGTRSRGIDPAIDSSLSEDEWRNPKYDYFDWELAEWKQKIKELYSDAKFYVASEAEGGTREAYSKGNFIGDWDGSGSPSCRIKKAAVNEMGSAVGGGAAGQSVANNPQQAAKVSQASTAIKAATNSTAPAPKLAQAIDRASQGQQVSAQDMRDLEPVMDVVKKTAEDPKLANQFKSLAQQARKNM